jgi:hypothetical protein
MRAPCSLLIPLLTVMACEPMDHPGSPWKPVPVVAQAPAALPAAGVDPDLVPEVEVDPMFSVPEPIVIHSSELGQAAGASDAPADPPRADEPALAAEPELAVEPLLFPEPAAEAQADYPPAPGGFAQFTTAGSGGWPLRLVATVPGAQPPRAILGLPGGQEVVVTPGTMLPDAGVVVMAIGSGSIELAEVRPAGDHAVVEARTLQAQRTQRIEIGAAQ